MRSCFSNSVFLVFALALTTPLSVAQQSRKNISVPTSSRSSENDELVKAVDSIAEKALSRPITGLSIGIMKEGRIVLSRGYGFSELEKKLAATEQTRYQIGSITKQFTAAAIMRLAEQKKLRLDDSITKYLPEFPTQGHNVTIRHLLNHTSGIKSYSDYFHVLDPPVTTTSVSPEQILASIKDKPFDFKPGEQFAYNNSGYFLLGLIIERDSGESYAKYLAEQFFTPLKMTSTSFCGVAPNTAIPRGYSSKGFELIKAPVATMSVSFAAGALCSTVGDLLVWQQALANGKALSPASLQQMTALTKLASGEFLEYGFGLWVSKYQGHRAIWHAGGISGFNSQMAHYPDERLTIVVLTNTFPAGAEEIERGIARKVFGIPEREVKDLPITPTEWAKYLGIYDLGQFKIRVFEENKILKAQVVGEDSFRLMYQGGHSFAAEASSDIRLTFTIENSVATKLTLDLRGTMISGKKTP